jgi:hypothetical protein
MNSYLAVVKTLGWEEAAEWAGSVGLHASATRNVQDYLAEDSSRQTVRSIAKEIWLPNEEPSLRWRTF